MNYTTHPPIIKPNLMAAKIVTILSLILSIFTLAPIMSFIYSAIGLEFGAIINVVVQLFYIFVLFFLAQYLLNFGLSSVNKIIYGLIAMCVIAAILWFILYNSSFNGQWGIIIHNSFSVLRIILYCCIGIKLVITKNDYVGGLSTTGYLFIGNGIFSFINTFLYLIIIYITKYQGIYTNNSLYSILTPIATITGLFGIALHICILIVYINADRYNDAVRNNQMNRY